MTTQCGSAAPRVGVRQRRRQRRRGERQRRDRRVRASQLGQLAGHASAGGCATHQVGAGGRGRTAVPDGGVEAGRGELQHAVARPRRRLGRVAARARPRPAWVTTTPLGGRWSRRCRSRRPGCAGRGRRVRVASVTGDGSCSARRRAVSGAVVLRQRQRRAAEGGSQRLSWVMSTGLVRRRGA